MTETLTFFYNDHLGSHIAMTDEDGNIQSDAHRIEYSIWGESETPAESGLPSFTGKQQDASGLYYFNARYYDPVCMRFLQEDPKKQGENWYIYCGNDPVNKYDPDGQLEQFWSFITDSSLWFNTNTAASTAAATADDVALNFSKSLNLPSFNYRGTMLFGLLYTGTPIGDGSVPQEHWDELGLSESFSLGLNPLNMSESVYKNILLDKMAEENDDDETKEFFRASVGFMTSESFFENGQFAKNMARLFNGESIFPGLNSGKLWGFIEHNDRIAGLKWAFTKNCKVCQDGPMAGMFTARVAEITM